MSLQKSDFELLLQANRILSSSLKIEDVLESVMTYATKVVKAEASSLLLLDEKKNELYFDVALGTAKEETIKRIRLKVGEGVAGWVAEKKEPLIVNDVSKDQRFTQKVDKSTKFKTKSILAVPLLAKGKLIGVIEALNKKKNKSFTRPDKEVFEAFASQAAIAIENARLFSEINREKEKLNTIFTEMSDAIVFLDEDQRIVILNDMAAQFLNLNLATDVGRRFDSPLLKGFVANPSLDQMQYKKGTVFQVDLERREGKELYLTGLCHKLHATKELPQGGALFIFRDVTEERKGEYLKRNFLSLVSHKLKTPLTVILGYAPILSANKDTFSPIQSKAIDAIYHQGQVLSELVDKLLRFTLLESETLNRKMESHSLKALIDKALEEMEPQRKDKNIVVQVDDDLTSLPQLELDSTLTIEVLKNLIENGIKFNNKDKIHIQIKAQESPNGIFLSIMDNGAGIPSEEKEKVFTKFYQVENSFTGQVPGAGLGLSICKRVMEEMGGSIALDSHMGQGTTVTLFFPHNK